MKDMISIRRVPARRRVLLLLPTLVLACGEAETVVEAPPPVPTTLAITPTSEVLTSLGQTVQLTATVRDQTGTPMSGVGVNWASSDAGIVTVDAAGVVTAMGNGATNITATAEGGGASGSAAITVSQQILEVRLTPDPPVFRAIGETLQMSAEALDANGHAVAGSDVTWATSDGTIATVNSDGLVTAVGNGNANITATSAADVAGGVVVEVAQEASVVSVSPESDTLRWLDTLRLSPEAFDANGHSVESAEFAWSSGDESVAQVDPSGLVKAKGLGSVEITASVSGSSAAGIATLLVEALPERDALVAFYHVTGGPNWKDSDKWLTDAPLGEWAGVRTGRSGAVDHVNLWDNGMSGSIPPELGALTQLLVLELIDNDLKGPIPSELEHLANLNFMKLRHNKLSGPIPPELGNLPSLESLDLGANELTGAIPAELARLTRLRRLWLDSNRLTGPILPELGGMTELRELTLTGNELSGSIPPELAGLAAVTVIRLGANELSGSIPPELGALPALRVLRLWENELTGSIPPELGDLASLTILDVSRNELTGPIPPEFGMLKNLEELSMHRNRLSGSIPPQLGNLTELLDLWLHENELAGAIPLELARLTNLKHLYFNTNSGLTGSIPQAFTGFELETFWWGETQLCAPPNEAFREWVLTIRTHRGGAECAAGG